MSLSLVSLVGSLGKTLAIRRHYKPLVRAELSEADLFSQANSLAQAGYNEAAVIVGCTAIRRRLKEILAVCPVEYYDSLPKKTSSWKQYATFELAYLFYNKGIIDQQLRRDLSQFQKQVSRVAYGVKLSRKKAERMLTNLNNFRPRLDEAMGRAKLMLPALELEPKPEQPSREEIDQLARVLPVAIDHWCRKAFGEPTSPIADPVTQLKELRSKLLISRKLFRAGRRLFERREFLETLSVKQLRKLLAVAQQGAGIRPQESMGECEPAACSEGSTRDARQVESWLSPSKNGGVPCQS